MMLFFGSLSAQETQYQFNYHQFEHGMTMVIQIQINGVEQQTNDIELGSFDGTTVTGSERIDEYNGGAWRVYFTAFFNNTYDISFKIYNHATHVEYDNYEISFQGSPYTLTLVDGAGPGTKADPLVLNFVTEQTYTKTITPYSATDGGWYLISSPIGNVAPENVTNMTNNSFDLYRFNQSADLEWENYKAGGEHYHFNLETGKGYLYANSGNVTLTFTGHPYNGNGQVTLTKDTDATFAGWNLVGNPFPQTAYITKSFYTINPTGRAEVIAGTGNQVEAMEGIFVIADTNDETMTFSTSAPDKANSQLVIDLSNSNSRSSAIDRAIVRFDNSDELLKFQLFEDNTKLYIPQNNKDYAIVNADNQGEIPVNFRPAENGTYTLSFNTENVTFGYLHLVDNFTGNDVDLLATPSYTFDANTCNYASRFKLVFAISNIDDEQFAFISNGEIILNGVNGNTTVQLFDVTGRMLSSTNGVSRISTENMASSVYMLRLINGNDTKTQKIIVK